MQTAMTRMPGMSPRARKPISPRSRRFEDRFALQLRDLVDKRGWGPSELRQRLDQAGLDVSLPAVKKWLNGSHLPRPQDMEIIGGLLGLRDYRHLLPPPR